MINTSNTSNKPLKNKPADCMLFGGVILVML